MSTPRDLMPNGHIQLGDTESFTQPPGFNAPDNGETCSGTWGRMMGSEPGLIEQTESPGDEGGY